jgi:recombination protein RecA
VVAASLVTLPYDLRLDRSVEAIARPHEWCLADLAGRLVQIEGAGDSAALTLAFLAILQAQQCGEPVAWITPRARAMAGVDASMAGSVFYPPDAYDTGIDLAALPVVRVPDVTAAFAAVDVLLRSGGFGLIVADLGDLQSAASTSLARLAGLARRHHTALLFLTRPPISQMHAWRRSRPSPPAILSGDTRGSLGSLISLHVHSRRRRIGRDQFECGLVVLKDKRRGPVWEYRELCRGAVGLR